MKYRIYIFENKYFQYKKIENEFKNLKKIHEGKIGDRMDESELEKLRKEIEETLEQGDAEWDEILLAFQKYTQGTCSIRIPPLQLPFSVFGPSNTLAAKYPNSYIPDLFRQCWLIKNIELQYLCPNIKEGPLVVSYLQKVIEDDIVKAFLYHGFSSDIFTNYSQMKIDPTSPLYTDYIIYLNEFERNIFTQNYGSYDNFAYYFFNKYPPYTLLQQLSFFLFVIFRAHNYSITGKVPCTYTVQWDATLVCAEGRVKTIRELGFFFDTPILNNIFETYNYWFSKNGQYRGISFLISAFLLRIGDFYQVLNLTKQVLRDVMLEFFYKQTQKTNCPQKYMSAAHYQECVRLYTIYTENKLKYQY